MDSRQRGQAITPALLYRVIRNAAGRLRNMWQHRCGHVSGRFANISRCRTRLYLAFFNVTKLDKLKNEKQLPLLDLAIKSSKIRTEGGQPVSLR